MEPLFLMATTVSIRIAAIDKASATINKIQSKLSGLNRFNGFKNVAQKFTQLTQPFQKFKDAVVSVSRATVGFAVFGASTAGLFRWGKAAADVANQIIDLSNKYRVSTESIQVYSSLIEGAGGTMEDVGKSMSKLRHAMAEALGGSSDYQAAFSGIGIAVDELERMSPEDVMLRMADAFSGSSNEMAKQEVLLKLLGKSGSLWLETLNEGADEYQNRLKEMNADGALISEDDMIRARQFNDTWDRISRLTRAIHVDFSLDFMKAFEPTLNRIRELMIKNRGVIRETLKEFAESLPPVLEVMTNFAQILLQILKFIFDIVGGLSERFGSLTTAIMLFSALFYKLILSVSSAVISLGKLIFQLTRTIGFIPLLLVSALVVAFTHIDDIINYVQKAFERIKKIFSGSIIEGIFAVLVELVTGLINGAIGLIKGILPSFAQPEWLKKLEFKSPTERLIKVYDKLPAAQPKPEPNPAPQPKPKPGGDPDEFDTNTSNVKGQITVKVVTDRGSRAIIQNMQSDKRLALQANTGVLFGGD